jgi:GTPase SAR1 family protein
VVQASRGERLVVGLTGYPNVGKSSTINALFGSKKTAVAPTPGKTKHFQVGLGTIALRHIVIGSWHVVPRDRFILQGMCFEGLTCFHLP